MQTKTQSIIETCASTAVGFAVALTAQVLIMRGMNIDTRFDQDFVIIVIFTIISLARGYAVRRFFNWRHRGAA
jgi:hypothetical protein